jgi:translation initiation factor 5B
MVIRSPILVLLGHVDHGKTTLADAIRGTAIAKKEAGGITQMIGASYITRETINEIAKALSQKMQFEIRIPGLLFIDTPGHEAFTNLRERGGSIADLAILVIDINVGFQPQTIESIKILKQYKTPFVVAANKIDTIDGWKSYKTTSFIETLTKQPEHVKARLDEKIYALIGKLSEYGFDSERFDRVTDFKKQVAIVPVSGKTTEGIGELLVLITGLSQRFLEDNLKIEVKGAGKGSILEIKEEKGLGTTIDVIVYDGIMRKGDDIIFLTNNGAKVTKIRALLEPNTSPGKQQEKYEYRDEVTAAAGVKIFAPDLNDALPGSPIKVVENIEEDKKNIEEQFKKIVFESEECGVVLCADSLGSVEALVNLLKEAKIPIKDAKVGKITKKEVLKAAVVKNENKYYGVVLGFNVAVLDEAREEAKNLDVPIIWSNIIYRLFEEYNTWVNEEKEKEKKEAMERLPWPAKIKVLHGCCFRMSKPAIFGIEVIGGKLKCNAKIMNKDGAIVGEIKEIQKEREQIKEATRGMQVAVSCDDVHFGKQICEEDILYTYISPEELKMWEKKLELLEEDERTILNEIKSKVMKTYF